MSRAVKVAVVAVVALALFGTAAEGELSRQGDLLVSFQGHLSPTRLPRRERAPVEVTVGGNVKTQNGLRLPQLKTISVGINKAGRLEDRGLPHCRISSIQPATEAVARKRCGDAIVGSGHVTLVVRLPSQADYTSRNNLLAFNGPRRNGKKLILAQVYSKNPPGAIILTFTVSKARGLYGNVIETTLPAYAQNWAYLTSFELTLGRTYTVHGERRSYISAACPAPAGLPGAIFPFGKATYTFDSGEAVSTQIVRSCKVAGK
jgi:hypothetical protein